MPNILRPYRPITHSFIQQHCTPHNQIGIGKRLQPGYRNADNLTITTKCHWHLLSFSLVSHSLSVCIRAHARVFGCQCYARLNLLCVKCFRFGINWNFRVEWAGKAWTRFLFGSRQPPKAKSDQILFALAVLFIYPFIYLFIYLFLFDRLVGRSDVVLFCLVLFCCFSICSVFCETREAILKYWFYY